MERRSAFVLTTSDRGAAGEREDTSGELVAERLRALGLAVERAVVPDEVDAIAAAIRQAAERHALVVTTGGTGLTPRDVTPQATASVLDYEVPGLAEAMREAGRRHTPMASLSRAMVGVRGQTLVVNLPGSPLGAQQSLDAILEVIPHALETLAGPFDHGALTGRSDLPPSEPEPGRPVPEASPAEPELHPGG
jgi:molybdenum cofactor synthesis domain-containing protein